MNFFILLKAIVEDHYEVTSIFQGEFQTHLYIFGRYDLGWSQKDRISSDFEIKRNSSVKRHSPCDFIKYWLQSEITKKHKKI